MTFQTIDPDGYEFTSQFFFDEDLTDEVLAQAPYPGGAGRTINAQDGIYQGGGDQLQLAVTPSGDGYASTFTVGLQV